MNILNEIKAQFQGSNESEWDALFMKETGKSALQNDSISKPIYSFQNFSAQQQTLQNIFALRKNDAFVFLRFNASSVTNNELLEALNNGVSALYINGVVKDIEVLFKNISVEHIMIAFNHTDSLTKFQSYCNKNNFTNCFGFFDDDEIGNAFYNGGQQNNDSIELTDTLNKINWFNQNNCTFKPIMINCGVFHYAGGNALKSLTYGLAVALEYINAGIAKGESPVSCINNIGFKFTVGIRFFEELSAMRAFYIAWHSLSSKICKDNQLHRAFIIAEPSLRFWSPADENNNMLRATTQCLSAMLAGVDGYIPFPHTVFNSSKNNFGNRIAKNVQLLLRDESFSEKVNDAAGGSYYVESLTEKYSQLMISSLIEIENDGGIVEMFKAGKLQNDLFNDAKIFLDKIKSGEQKIIGSNCFTIQNSEITEKKGQDFFEKPKFNLFVPLKPILASG